MERNQKKFVRNENDKKEGTHFSLRAAFRCAGSGLYYAVITQRNIAIQIGISVFAILLGFLLSLPLFSWLAIIVCIALVLAAECINTAIESVVDLVSPEYTDLAKHAKDCAAAGVLICSLCSLIVACLVYGQALISALKAGSFI